MRMPDCSIGLLHCWCITQSLIRHRTADFVGCSKDNTLKANTWEEHKKQFFLVITAIKMTNRV
jgi:hypothetical protein